MIIRHQFKLVHKSTGEQLQSLWFDETFLFERARDYAKTYRDRFAKRKQIPKHSILIR